MNKKTIIGTLIGVGVIVILAAVSSSTAKPSETMSRAQNDTPRSEVAEKIEVVHFHATQQCWSCITVGEGKTSKILDFFSHISD